MMLGSACEENQVVGIAGKGRLEGCREWQLETGAEVPIDSSRRGIGHLSGVLEWLQCYDSRLYFLDLNFQSD